MKSRHTWVSHMGKTGTKKCVKCGTIRVYGANVMGGTNVKYLKNGEEFSGVAPDCINYHSFDELSNQTNT